MNEKHLYLNTFITIYFRFHSTNLLFLNTLIVMKLKICPLASFFTVQDIGRWCTACLPTNKISQLQWQLLGNIAALYLVVST